MPRTTNDRNTESRGRIGSPWKLAAASLALLAFLPARATAQAWVPDKGGLDLSVTYQYVYGGDHLFSRNVDGMDMGAGYVGHGDTAFVGRDIAHALILGVDYGLTERLALDASLAMVATRYEGKMPISQIDNGNTHASFQDLTVELRYMLLRSPIVVTPAIGFLVPTHDYEDLGHSAFGRNLRELRLGAYLGRTLDPLLPDGYLTGGYAYSFIENPDGIDLDMSNASLEAGYVLPIPATLQIFSHYQKTHGGLDWLTDLESETDFRNRNRAAAETFVRLGFGGTVTLSDEVSITASYSWRVLGENTTDGRTAQITASYGF